MGGIQGEIKIKDDPYRYYSDVSDGSSVIHTPTRYRLCLTSMETFCLAIAFSTSLYMSVLCIPSPQNIVKAYLYKKHKTRSNKLRLSR